MLIHFWDMREAHNTFNTSIHIRWTGDFIARLTKDRGIKFNARADGGDGGTGNRGGKRHRPVGGAAGHPTGAGHCHHDPDSSLCVHA